MSRDLSKVIPIKGIAYKQRLPTLLYFKDARFYNEYPSNVGDAASAKPVVGPLRFSLSKPRVDLNKRTSEESYASTRPHWAVIGADPTPFLRAVKGDFVAVPPNSRSYPDLASRNLVPSQAIKYVGFNSGTKGGQGVQGAYLSARYESRREETDWTLEQYLKGQTELNPAEESIEPSATELTFRKISQDLALNEMLKMPVSMLSNGQTRRSRIAKALLEQPELLLLDQPFMGLDPATMVKISNVLRTIAYGTDTPTLLLGLRPQDPIPRWITHLVVLSSQNQIIVADDMLQVLYLMTVWNRGKTSGLAAEIQLAEALSSKYNELLPPFESPQILTHRGIRRFYKPGDRFKADKDADGIWTPGASLTKDDVLRRKVSLLKTPKKREITDWMAVTATLNRAHYRELAIDLDMLRHQRAPESTIDEKVVEMAQHASSPARVREHGEPLIEFSDIVVRYGERTVLGHTPPGLNLTINRGSRVLLLGPNGSGKTTFLSLLTSDHPQSYSLPIKFFGRTRLAERGKPGLSLWEIQSRIGHSSPEVHAFFPKHFTVRQVLESAWAETFSSRPVLDRESIQRVERMLEYWALELCQDRKLWVDNAARRNISWASDKENHPRFGALPYATQRLLLLLRAIIKSPDIVVLDEAFSGFSDVLRDRALKFLDHGFDSNQEIARPTHTAALNENQALIVVSHVREEIPYSIDEFVKLPGAEEIQEGKPVVTGRAHDIRTERGWNRIWGL